MTTAQHEEARHTPGPAKGPYTTDTVIYEGSRAYNIEVYDRDEFLIAEVFGRSVAAAEATARLIASAPDLLKACIWAEAALAPFSKEPAEKSGINMLRNAIRAALAPQEAEDAK